MLFLKIIEIFKKTSLNKSTSPRQKAYNTRIIFNVLVANMYPSLKNIEKMKENDVGKTPAEPSKSKENHLFYWISAKITKLNQIRNHAKSMKTKNTKKLIKPLVFSFFGSKHGSRDVPWMPGPRAPETIFNWNTCIKVDFFRKSKIEKKLKKSSGAKLCL